MICIKVMTEPKSGRTVIGGASERGTLYNGELGLYTESDSSVKIIEAMGLDVHPTVRDLSFSFRFMH